MKALPVLVLGLILAGCNAYYELIKPGQVQVKYMTVSPGVAWNKERLPELGENVDSWTVDGVLLNQLIFSNGVEDGQPVFGQVSPGNTLPVFKSDMLPNEIMEITAATLNRYLGGGEVLLTTSDLKPMTFLEKPGFEFTFYYQARSGLAHRGIFTGTLKDGRLYFIMFRAAELHYFEKYENEVRDIIQTARIEWPKLQPY